MNKNVISAFFLLLQLSLLSQPPPTVGEALKSKGIETTVNSLRIALQDPRAEVRGLAAVLLAEKQDADSIPAIRLALNKATTTLEKLNLAQALLALGSAEGTAATKSICSDKSAREDLRMIAASRLVEVGSGDCIGSVVEMLLNTSSPITRQTAMNLLKANVPLPNTLRLNLSTGLVRALSDEVPSNRQLASECITSYKLVEAVGSLKRASELETDADVRLHMQADLTKLSK